MSALEPCPFCGGRGNLHINRRDYYVYCGDCSAEGPWDADGDTTAAIAAWNRRATPAAPAKGCICPPGSEATCKGLTCPRRAVDGRAVA